MDSSYVRSRVRTRTHGSVGRRELRLPLTRYVGIAPTRLYIFFILEVRDFMAETSYFIEVLK
jgi:hypothetical protein